MVDVSIVAINFSTGMQQGDVDDDRGRRCQLAVRGTSNRDVTLARTATMAR